MHPAVKTDTAHPAVKPRENQEDMIKSIRKDICGIRDDIHALQVRMRINELLLEAVAECDENARYVEDYKNGYVTGYELVELLKLISDSHRYDLALALLERAECVINR